MTGARHSGETNALRLTTGVDAYPAWLSDGTRIAFARGGSNPGIYTVSAIGGTERKLAALNPNSQLSASPDGQWLASGNQDGTVKMWDARSWTPEVREERDALSLIYFLRDQAKPKAEWLAAISADETISEPVRQRALQFARDWK